MSAPSAPARCGQHHDPVGQALDSTFHREAAVELTQLASPQLHSDKCSPAGVLVDGRDRHSGPDSVGRGPCRLRIRQWPGAAEIRVRGVATAIKRALRMMRARHAALGESLLNTMRDEETCNTCPSRGHEHGARKLGYRDRASMCASNDFVFARTSALSVYPCQQLTRIIRTPSLIPIGKSRTANLAIQSRNRQQTDGGELIFALPWAMVWLAPSRDVIQWGT